MNQKTNTYQENQTVDATFQVVIKGVQPNVSRTEARAKLATLFKASLEQIDNLLATSGYVVKKAITFDVASKYKSAIEAAGGVCELLPEGAPISLAVDLPNAGPFVAEAKKGESNASPAHGIPASDVPSSKEKISNKWKKIFILFEKAGGPKLPKIKELSFWERKKVIVNGWGLCCINPPKVSARLTIFRKLMA